jgi:hypothetical protein
VLDSRSFLEKYLMKWKLDNATIPKIKKERDFSRSFMLIVLRLIFVFQIQRKIFGRFCCHDIHEV